ncbi:MAG TPA: thioredoxin domain-containing protein [Pyrinomonadaceae bacterium]|nr:thioredoxin domain-containing protein [Pyrinomonadaceae bacterium]
MNNHRPFLIIAFVLLVTAAGSALLLRSNDSSHRSDDGPVATNTNQSSETKTVTLEEFGDYQCPACAQLHPTLKKLKQEYGEKLSFIFRNLPLTAVHKNAMLAAQAAEAARMQNHFWEMHDLLYERQERWKDDINPRPIFVKFAEELGLNTWEFSRNLNDKQVQMRIEADMDSATEKGINGTPTILINGRQLRAETTTPEGVRQGIELMFAGKARN